MRERSSIRRGIEAIFRCRSIGLLRIHASFGWELGTRYINSTTCFSLPSRAKARSCVELPHPFLTGSRMHLPPPTYGERRWRKPLSASSDCGPNSSNRYPHSALLPEGHGPPDSVVLPLEGAPHWGARLDFGIGPRSGRTRPNGGQRTFSLFWDRSGGVPTVPRPGPGSFRAPLALWKPPPASFRSGAHESRSPLQAP